MDIGKIVDEMQAEYEKDLTFSRLIKFNDEEEGFIQNYKDNICIHFMIPDLTALQKGQFSEFNDVSFWMFDISQLSYIKKCKKGKIRYEEILYDTYNEGIVNVDKVLRVEESMFLTDQIGDRIIWGWDHIVAYTNMVWNQAYQKYNILPKMKEIEKVRT